MAPLKAWRGIGRRKSSGNVLEDVKNPPGVESSFRVLERPNHAREKSFDGGVKLARAYQPTRPDTMYDLGSENIFDDIGSHKSQRFRGSGGSTSNITTTTDNSSRFSAASTAPSSIDEGKNDELRSYAEKLPAYTPPPSSKSPFSLKATGRNFSFGLGKDKKLVNNLGTEPLSPVTDIEKRITRPRSQTFDLVDKILYPVTSRQSQPPSPQEPDTHILASFGRRKSKLPVEYMTSATAKSSSEPFVSEVTEPQPSVSPRKRLPQHPAPLDLDHHTQIEEPPYSWASRNSTDRLMRDSSPTLPTSRHDVDSPAPTPAKHNVSFLDSPETQVIADESENDSVMLERIQSYGDELAAQNVELLQDSLALSQLMEGTIPLAANPADHLSEKNARTPDEEFSFRGSMESTPRPCKAGPTQVNNMFEKEQFGHPALAKKTSQQVLSHFKADGKIKVMSREQFEEYKRAQEVKKRIDDERIRSFGGTPRKNEDEDDDDDIYEEEQDETEKRRELAKARRKQEAHLAVYRQQMLKVTGEAAPIPSLVRPSMQTSPSLPNIAVTAQEDEEDDEIPLGVLAAHGFPNKNRQPGQLRSMDPNGTFGRPPIATGALPVFARNFPQDPYVGASLVNTSSRESFSYGSTGSFAHQNTPRQPTGLVNVIAKEEKDRAMRRGHSSTTGEYGTSMSLSHSHPPQQSPNVPEMPMSPTEQAQFAVMQQMQQFMSMQMQFMTQTMAVDASSSRVGQQLSPDFFVSKPSPHFLQPHERASTTGTLQPPSTTTLRPGSSASQRRTMTMLDPNIAPWRPNSILTPPLSKLHNPGTSYAPSMAPSERNNIGQPGRYRPVTNTPIANASRLTSMEDADPTAASDTIRKVLAPLVDEEEDEEAVWAQMKQLKEKKKSVHRAKKELDISAIRF